MSRRFKFLILLGVLAFTSLQYSSYAKRFVADATNSLVGSYLNFVHLVEGKISAHFNQLQTIRTQEEKIKRFEKSHTLLLSFAGKLNRLLEEHDQSPYRPHLQLVQSLSYEQISNYNRVWIDMEDFNSSKIYGLISKGNTAGIVIAQDGKPLALLQGDSKCVFSVSIGKDKLPGVSVGKGEFIHARYIPLWMQPKVGDEVVTSGLDEIFPAGIPVGKVVKIQKEESYQSAIIKPNAVVNTPAFFYIIK